MLPNPMVMWLRKGVVENRGLSRGKKSMVTWLRKGGVENGDVVKGRSGGEWRCG